MKICGKRKVEKPAVEFSKCSRSKDGLQHRCKACHAVYQAANKDRIDAKKALYREANKEKKAIYRAKNKESIAQYMAEYRRANRERISAQRAVHRAANKGRAAEYRAANKERLAKYAADYAAANPDKRAARRRNRRARELSAEGRHTASDVMAIFERQRGLCASCEVKLFKSGKQKFHVDHILSLANGGSNWPSNLQCLCPLCNRKKSAKDPIEWAQENGKLL